MPELPFLPFYYGDFRNKTAYLTFDERSAYFWLLVAMWTRDGSVPDEDRDIARSMNISLRRWRSMKPRIMPFLTRLPDGNLTQDRLQSEYEKAKLKSEKLRNNGRMGGRPPLKENNELPKAKGSSLLKPGLSTQIQNHKDKEVIGGKVDLAGEAKALFSENEIASAKLACPLVDVDDELRRLTTWARDKWPTPPEQRRKIMAALVSKQSALALAPQNLADRDKPLMVSPELLNSPLLRAARH